MCDFLLYIDPGTGSMLLQALIAGALTIAMFFKHLKLRVLTFLGKIKPSEESREMNEQEDIK
jgi:hypothetical protein